MASPSAASNLSAWLLFRNPTLFQPLPQSSFSNQLNPNTKNIRLFCRLFAPSGAQWNCMQTPVASYCPGHSPLTTSNPLKGWLTGRLSPLVCITELNLTGGRGIPPRGALRRTGEFEDRLVGTLVLWRGGSATLTFDDNATR